MLNNDGANNSGPLTPNATLAELESAPRAHVALAIMRTGAVNLSEDTHDDPVAERQARAPRRISQRL